MLSLSAKDTVSDLVKMIYWASIVILGLWMLTAVLVIPGILTVSAIVIDY